MENVLNVFSQELLDSLKRCILWSFRCVYYFGDKDFMHGEIRSFHEFRCKKVMCFIFHDFLQ